MSMLFLEGVGRECEDVDETGGDVHAGVCGVRARGFENGLVTAFLADLESKRGVIRDDKRLTLSQCTETLLHTAHTSLCISTRAH